MEGRRKAHIGGSTKPSACVQADDADALGKNVEVQYGHPRVSPHVDGHTVPPQSDILDEHSAPCSPIIVAVAIGGT
jgi:hypothetical protein